MKTVLLATDSECGQANVFLAAGHALQARDASVQIHFASFAAISGRKDPTVPDYGVGPGTKIHGILGGWLDSDQVCPPPWMDCYDIGRWGNKRAMPRWSEHELGPILIDVLLGPDAAAMRSRVQELAAICNKTPGSDVAAAAIIEVMDGKKDK
ncbi:glycosyltransferase family 1 protein [Trichocladium antarcticum]|uniref:Glycosyltransferase family 1 protein n=1 Tax=Trichocladium antarcticum TaxID=1450529 RepID=A0AAN6ZER9_9PEZI|nr:glycosyltransferase family 1 protein [Trichocladium antarcticum]